MFGYFIFRSFSFSFDVWLGKYGTKFFLAIVRKPDKGIGDIIEESIMCKNADEEIVDVPVVVISSESDEGLQVDMLGMGVNDYITKPFSPKVLIARVNSVVRRSKKSEVKIK